MLWFLSLPVNRQVYPLILSEGVYLKYSDVSKQELEKQWSEIC